MRVTPGRDKNLANVTFIVSLLPYRWDPSSVGRSPLSENGGDMSRHGIIPEANAGSAQAVGSDVPREVQVGHAGLSLA